MLALAGCGGGSSDGDVGGGALTPATTNVTTTVIDGAIKNAVVCLDKNGNGKCDADEVQGKTDAGGNVTLAVPNADVGKYPVIAVVGTDAVDADHGPVTTAYTMSTPADQTGVVSPLTTLVQQTIASTGATTAEAAKSVQDATGLTVSLFQDFTKAAAPSDGTVSAATVARMVVVTTQQQASTIASAVGTTAIDGSTITQANLDAAIQKKLLELLPGLVQALSDPTVLAATTAADKEAALLAAASALVTNSGLTPGAVATAVAINNQAASPVTEPTTPVAGLSLRALSFADAANYVVRSFTYSAAQNTPDSTNNVKFVERRRRSIAGKVASWGYGGDPTRAAELHWNGSAWANCSINFENTNTVTDAQGNSTYSYCDKLETGTSNRAIFDIAGKTMAEVYATARAAGFSNLEVANATTALGTATFPAGSKLAYHTNTPLTAAVSYYPGGAGSPVGTSNIVTQYNAAISAGGDAATQGSDVACNSAETRGSGAHAITLEGMIAARKGTPCVYAQGSFVYGGVTYTGDVANEWWGNSTVSVGKIGTAPINSGAAPGYYTTNTQVRVAFTGSGTNPVTYYACKERFTDGSPRSCAVVGTGTYAITTLGDARVLTLTNPPLQAAPLTYNRAFVERGGYVYFGSQSKPVVVNTVRLNAVAANALLTQLGIPTDDPTLPVELTAASYQGTWDFRDAMSAVSATEGTTIFINGSGGVSCQDKSTATFFGCTLTITDAATGAFTYTEPGTGTVANGSFAYTTGAATAVYHDPTSMPTDGNIVGARR